jgi:predicted RND superfamily exporter protein
MENESESANLWVEQESDAYKNYEFVKDNWKGGTVLFRFLVQAKSKGDNALTTDVFKDAMDFAEKFKAVKGDDGTTFEDLCWRDAIGKCGVYGLLRFLPGNQTNVNLANNDALLQALSQTTWPDSGKSVQRDEYMAEYKTHTNGDLSSGPVWRFGFIFKVDEEGEVPRKAWEEKVVDTFTEESKSVKQDWQHMHLEIYSYSRSLNDELKRVVSGDISFMGLAFTFLISSCAFFLGHPFKCVLGLHSLGVLELFVVLLGIIAGYGLSCLFGVKFTSLAQVLPFILVGIGVDDAFVLTSAFKRTDRSWTVEERVRDAVEMEGMSITLTSLTDIIAFLCGSTSAFPAVSFFCVYAGMSLVFIYTYHVTLFPALLALDQRRRKANRMDFLCCIRMGTNDPTEDEPEGDSLSVRIMEKYTKAITHNIVVKLIIVAAFIIVSALCLWQAVDKTDTEFDILDVTPDESYMRDYLNVEEQYWKGVSSELNTPVGLYFRDIDFSDGAIQAKMHTAENDLLNVGCINEDVAIVSWHRQFTQWADNSGKQLTQVGAERFLTGPSVRSDLETWLNSDGKHFKNDVQLGSGSILKGARSHVRQERMDNSNVQKDCLTAVEEFIEAMEAELANTFVFSPVYIFYHQYRIIYQELLWTVGMCFIAVIAITSMVIPSPLAVVITFLVIALVFIDLLGALPIWGISLNSISMVNLVMAVGLVVDYSMHIVHSFVHQEPGKSRDERIVASMKELGIAVFKGVLSTFIAILPLAFASSEIFRVFFKLFLSILIVGGSHGLVLMPVVLSLVGPAAARDLSKVHPEGRYEGKASAWSGKDADKDVERSPSPDQGR